MERNWKKGAGKGKESSASRTEKLNSYGLASFPVMSTSRLNMGGLDRRNGEKNNVEGAINASISDSDETGWYGNLHKVLNWQTRKEILE